MSIDYDKENLASELRGSLLEFTKFFFKYLNGRDFIVSQPVGRESHHITICRELTKAFRLEIPNHRLLINVPPGHAKSTLLCMWVAWALSHYPDSRFIYISYSQSLAARHTDFIKKIISSKMYNYLFGVSIRTDSKAKDNFMTTAGGLVAAFGSAGSIVGVDAGYPGLDRFSGAVLLDDLHKIDEVHSDTMRQNVIDNYSQTIQQRPRGVNVPIICIGQRVHEADIAAFLLEGKDGYDWSSVILRALDDAGNALYPEAFPKEMLLIRKDTDPYTYSSQFDQNPTPAGGSVFHPEWFLELSKEPEILKTFITADTAETDKTYNDATVFSFWGLYEIEVFGRKTGEMGLHWLDTIESWVEPKDLEELFINFWTDCSRHKVQPKIAYIEKKSTGVTLISTIKNIQGIQIREIQRGSGSGSKTTRFLEVQPFAASKRITFTEGARHVKLCKDHLMKITANETHRRDDICDTFCDAVRIALIDNLIYKVDHKDSTSNKVMNQIAANMRKQQQIRNNRNGVY